MILVLSRVVSALSRVVSALSRVVSILTWMISVLSRLVFTLVIRFQCQPSRVKYQTFLFTFRVISGLHTRHMHGRIDEALTDMTIDRINYHPQEG